MTQEKKTPEEISVDDLDHAQGGVSITHDHLVNPYVTQGVGVTNDHLTDPNGTRSVGVTNDHLTSPDIEETTTFKL